MASATHKVTYTDSGHWFHGASTDFIFGYFENDMDEKVKQDATKAFKDALQMPAMIKKAAKDTSGKEVVDGLHLAHRTEMINAMRSIEGMSVTAVVNRNEKGEGTAVKINQQFFESVLSGLKGDVAPIMKYLNKGMAKVQVQAKKSDVAENFGTIIGFVSLMPVVNVPVTTFVYAYASVEEHEWFVKVNCGSTEHHSYDFKYTTVHYNYVKPATQEKK